MKNIIIRAVIPLHNRRSAVYKLLNLFPLRFRDNGFVAVLYNFPLLPRNDVVSVGTYPLLVCLADNVCALVKWISQMRLTRKRNKQLQSIYFAEFYNVSSDKVCQVVVWIISVFFKALIDNQLLHSVLKGFISVFTEMYFDSISGGRSARQIRSQECSC